MTTAEKIEQIERKIDLIIDALGLTKKPRKSNRDFDREADAIVFDFLNKQKRRKRNGNS